MPARHRDRPTGSGNRPPAGRPSRPPRPPAPCAAHRAQTRPAWSKVACGLLPSHIVGVPPPKNKLLEGPILRSLLTLAVPIVAANALQSAYQLIDAFWVGRLGGAAVAAV